jgi:hypothetical protein
MSPDDGCIVAPIITLITQLAEKSVTASMKLHKRAGLITNLIM